MSELISTRVKERNRVCVFVFDLHISWLSETGTRCGMTFLCPDHTCRPAQLATRRTSMILMTNIQFSRSEVLERGRTRCSGFGVGSPARCMAIHFLLQGVVAFRVFGCAPQGNFKFFHRAL